MNWQALDMSILGPAILAGCIVLLTHIPLGRRVLQRGIIFIDLAIAQIAGMGVIAAGTLFEAESGVLVQLSAFSAALLGAIGLHFSERYWPEVQEAIIGCTFVLAATGSILLLANNPHGGEQLKNLLAGQVLWVTYEQLWMPLLISAALLLLLRNQKKGAGNLVFYLSFAVAVTTSVQLVGVYLVFASLIVPALFTRNLAVMQLTWAGIIGVAGYASGLLLSALFDLPASPLIVWMLAVCGLMFTVLSKNSLVTNMHLKL